jgi:hypothetical protein
MLESTISEFYERHIKPLSAAERLRLLELTARDLAGAEAVSNERPTGLTRFIGAAQGSFTTPADADDFIRRERDAWGS